MKNLIIIAVLVIVIALAVLYVYRAKKNGDKCIGCPYSKECNKRCNSVKK